MIEEARQNKRDAVVLGKMMEKLKKIASKVQKAYHSVMQDASFGGKVVPVPIKTERVISGIDRKIVEEGITQMIYRANKGLAGENVRDQLME